MPLVVVVVVRHLGACGFPCLVTMMTCRAQAEKIAWIEAIQYDLLVGCSVCSLVFGFVSDPRMNRHPAKPILYHVRRQINISPDAVMHLLFCRTRLLRSRLTSFHASPAAGVRFVQEWRGQDPGEAPSGPGTDHGTLVSWGVTTTHDDEIAVLRRPR